MAGAASKGRPLAYLLILHKSLQATPFLAGFRSSMLPFLRCRAECRRG